MEDTITAAKRYAALEPDREPFLRRARRASALTIPSLMPPEGHDGRAELVDPQQSLGARGVNNLASKLLLALFPPSESFFRFPITPHDMQELGEDLETKSLVEHGLSQYERRVQKEMEVRAYRVDEFEILKHLLVSGNELVNVSQAGALRAFDLSQYVCLRDADGELKEVVLQETIYASDVPEGVDIAGMDTSNESVPNIDLYTHMIRKKNRWTVYQEINDQVVPDTEGSYSRDNFPWLGLRLRKVHGENYGRGYVDDYIGDLLTLESLTKALEDAAREAARVVYFVDPNSMTDEEDVRNAQTGDVVTGNAADVSTLRLDKSADMRVAYEQLLKIQDRLSFAFLLNTAVQRTGERVTAAEIRYMAAELEDALGGVYSILSQEFQLPLVKLVLGFLTKRGILRPLPKQIEPSVVTGIDALGRNHEIDRLDQFLEHLAKALGPDILAQLLIKDEYSRRVATLLSIDLEGLIRSEAELQAQQEQQQMAALAERAAPNVINALSQSTQQQPQGGP